MENGFSPKKIKLFNNLLKQFIIVIKIQMPRKNWHKKGNYLWGGFKKPFIVNLGENQPERVGSKKKLFVYS